MMHAHTDRIIIALDVPNTQQALQLVDALPPEVRFFKVGLELFCAEGPTLVQKLVKQGCRIFLDLKMHDIPNTVAHAIRSAGQLGVDLMTVHATGGRAMLEAAAEAARTFPEAQRPRLVAVTCLTSLTQDDLGDMGVERTLSDQALGLAKLAQASGIDGVVCSPLEAERLRNALGPDAILVTPGIRMPEDDAGDQRRIATPAAALKAGSSYLVIGRSITGAKDPALAAKKILAHLEAEGV